MAGLGETVAALARRRQLGGEPSAAPASDLPLVDGFGANPGALKMRLHLPSDLQAGSPLVVVLHGCTQTAAAYAEGAGWLGLADRMGFAVLCPEQTRANNVNLCFNWFQPQDTTRGEGEAASIHQMVAHAVALHGLDAKRVFVTGLSAGGAMAAVMLAAYPEAFAAGAVVAGLPYGAANGMQEAFSAMFQGVSRTGPELGERVRKASAHKGPWPRLSIWHGDGDTTVHPSAGEALVRQWTDLHGLKLADGERTVSGRHSTRVWRSATGEAPVEFHGFAGMGHGAPVSALGPEHCGTAGPFLLEAGVSSSREIARFWGLDEAVARPAAQPKPASRPKAEHPQPPASAKPRPVREPRQRPRRPFLAGPPDKLDVGDIIAKALKSAGLLK